MDQIPPLSRLKHVDVAVFEVGLGGKFDATNVVCDARFQRRQKKNIELCHLGIYNLIRPNLHPKFEILL